jgi:hypothetical protein
MTVGLDGNDEVTNGDGVGTTPINLQSTNKQDEKGDAPAGISSECNSEDVPAPFASLNRASDNVPDKNKTVGSIAITAPDRKANRRSCIAKSKRCYIYFVSHWPRTCAILTKVATLWALICWALLLGLVLSDMEGPEEILSNDGIMREKFLLSNLPLNQTRTTLSVLPKACLDNYLVAYNASDFATSIFSSDNATFNVNNRKETLGILSGESNADFSIQDFFAEYFPNYSLPEVAVDEPPSLAALYEYMEECQEIAPDLLDALVTYSSRVAIGASEAAEPLTFNWIRCWNASNPKLGQNRNPWAPNEEQINASANQAAYFQLEWISDQKALDLRYVQEWNCSEEKLNETRCLLDAWEAAVQGATGGRGCTDNTGSSAWFWFTVMTSTFTDFASALLFITDRTRKRHDLTLCVHFCRDSFFVAAVGYGESLDYPKQNENCSQSPDVV